MNRRHYLSLLGWLRATPGRERLARLLCRGLPGVAALLYCVTLAWLLWQQDSRWVRYLLVPFALYLAVSALRRGVDLPRPFTQLGFTPLLPHPPGRSFPSKHTASAVVIALANWYLSPWYGGATLVLAGLIGFSRLAAGLHYPRDVLGGAALALLVGVPGFWLVP